MPNTTSRGYRTPLTAEPLGPVNFEQLAADVNADVGGVDARLARAETFDGFRRWAWGGIPYNFLTDGAGGVWKDPPGASRTFTLLAGHLYQISSGLSVLGGGFASGEGRICRFSVWARKSDVAESEIAHQIDEGQLLIQGALDAVTLLGYVRPTVTASHTVYTRIATNGATRVYRDFQSPHTSIADLGYRASA